MNIPTIIEGNTFALAIPLQVYAIEDDELVLHDYVPESGDNVTIGLKGARRNYSYTPTFSNNIAFVALGGNELCGIYAVEVAIVKDDGTKLTSFKGQQLKIVKSIDELTATEIVDGVSQNVLYLDPEIFIAGKDGRGIVSITLTGTSGLVDTYTITYTDNTTSTFTVTNGEDGRSEQSDWAQTDPSADDYIKNKPSLATVATSGSYNDLLNKPTIPAAQVQSDWNESDSSKVDYIKNKPTIPTVPSNVSAFNNDAGYLTQHQSLANYYTKGEVDSALDDKQDTITDLATIRSGASLGATAYQKPNGGIPKSDLASSVQTSLGLADSALQQHQDLSTLADGAEYDSTTHYIYLKHGSTRLPNPINAADFIKDGMVDTVTISNGNLVISFNTDAGKQPISLPISDIFNANNYYTKTEIDNKGYLTSETDPVFAASAAAGITSSDITNWNSKTSNTGTVTSVGMSVPTGLSVSGTPVTSSGTLTVTFATGYSIPTTAKQGNWDAAYTDKHTHANKSVLDGITSNDITNWNAAEPNVQSDWDASSGDAAILNKPTIPTESTVSGWGFTKNTGTITGITMNGVSKGTSGVVNLGTVVTTETDPTVPAWAKANTKPTYNGSEIKYTGTTGNVVTNNTTLNVAIKAIDDAIGNVETLLASI